MGVGVRGDGIYPVWDDQIAKGTVMVQFVDEKRLDREAVLAHEPSPQPLSPWVDALGLSLCSQHLQAGIRDL